MTISINRYVDATSGVGGVAGVPRRNLILRLYTQNALVPAGAVVSITQLSDVGTFFGQASDEYAVAEKYFGFVSKTITSPNRLSFVRWHPDAVPPALYGGKVTAGLSALKAITAGTLTISSGGVTDVIAGIDLSTATDMASVAALLQTELRAGTLPQLNQCIVQYESNRGAFTLVGGMATPGDELFVVATTGTGDMASVLGWLPGQSTKQLGADAQTPVQAVQRSADEDDNFGSLAFVGTVHPTLAEATAVAAWVHAQNNKFMYCVGVTDATGPSWQTALAACSGVALGLNPVSSADHAETCPAEILAATDYSQPGASQNYMYYRFNNRAPTVNDNQTADRWDALRVNYIGQTQTAGRKISFYQQGFLQGGDADALDMAVFTGEMWLKDAFISTIFGGLLALPNMPASQDGRITILSLMQEPIDQAVLNGVVAVGKDLDATQKAYITQITGNAGAWRQVQSKGYWVDAQVVKVTENNVTKYVAQYTFIYGKNDQIRKVTGRDIMI